MATPPNPADGSAGESRLSTSRAPVEQSYPAEELPERLPGAPAGPTPEITALSFWELAGQSMGTPMLMPQNLTELALGSQRIVVGQVEAVELLPAEFSGLPTVAVKMQAEDGSAVTALLSLPYRVDPEQLAAKRPTERVVWFLGTEAAQLPNGRRGHWCPHQYLCAFIEEQRQVRAPMSPGAGFLVFPELADVSTLDGLLEVVQ